MNKVVIAMDYHPRAQKVAEAGFSLASEDGLRKASEHFLEKAKHHLGDETIRY